ncbi:Uncharacterized conserved protein [Poseidonocella pacifica]|uniref:Uncharacterized conserved protein n=1 Tax=Poseidonocella pacifica TaxID=871651 RepID=A0A1I0YSH8_9RHOB|nr:GFA family protein [Poseidonocella pacifica]SFB16254.1 Uncharacterized conserved protein [Poseidonocella pacifica]
MNPQSVTPSEVGPAEEDTISYEAFGEGGCACGAVRYRVRSAPMIVHACHCRLCQKQTGSSNAVNALIEADRIVVLAGTIEETLLETPSGRGQRIARCTSCKVALWSNYLITNQGDHLRFLRVGTLDDPSIMPPDVHIFIESQQPWYMRAPGVAAAEGIYRHKTTWSKDSLNRLKQLTRKTGFPFK